MTKFLKCFLISIFIFFCTFIFVYAEEIDISSKNVILYNLKDNSVIYEKNPDDKVYIASLTKIMTAIVAIENIEDLDQRILITGNMINNLANDLSKVGFIEGEVVTYRDLLYGTLLKSGADATDILAISISGSVNEFVKLMNQKAKDLGMDNSNFENTIGIEGTNHHSSARDLATLLKYAIKNETFLEVFSSKTYISTNKEHDMNGPLKYITDKDNINFKYIKGAKTGYTSKAGLCLASIATYKGIDYLLVTIGADYENKTQHMEDSKKIYEYFFNNYEYKKIISKGDIIVKLNTVYGKEYDIISDETYESYLNKNITNEDLTYEYKGISTLGRDIRKNDKIGTFYIKYNDEVLYTKSITSPVTVKFDLLFFLKQNIILISLLGILILLLILAFRIKKR